MSGHSGWCGTNAAKQRGAKFCPCARPAGHAGPHTGRAALLRRAAPDLLAAAKLALGSLAFGDVVDSRDPDDTTINALRAAVARAEGKET